MTDRGRVREVMTAMSMRIRGSKGRETKPPSRSNSSNEGVQERGAHPFLHEAQEVLEEVRMDARAPGHSGIVERLAGAAVGHVIGAHDDEGHARPSDSGVSVSWRAEGMVFGHGHDGFRR